MHHPSDEASKSHGNATPLIRSDGVPSMPGHQMGSDVTRPQIAAVTILTALAFVAGILWSVAHANLTIGAHEVAGAVMPPGMITTRDTPAEAMRDMAAVNPNAVRYVAPAEARGDQPLEPRIEDGVKVFDLEASVIEWHILPNVP